MRSIDVNSQRMEISRSLQVRIAATTLGLYLCSFFSIACCGRSDAADLIDFVCAESGGVLDRSCPGCGKVLAKPKNLFRHLEVRVSASFPVLLSPSVALRLSAAQEGVSSYLRVLLRSVFSHLSRYYVSLI
jgi:hypothetical protein